MSISIPSHDPAITIPIAEQDKIRRKLNQELLPLMDETFGKAVSGSVVWNQNKWLITLDWIEYDLKKRLLYGSHIPPNERGEKSPLYQYFELFDRARMQGELSKPVVIALLFAVIKAMTDVSDKAMEYFDVHFEVKDGTRLPLEPGRS